MTNANPKSESELPGSVGDDELRQPVIFSALLKPHRSLGPRGFAILMGFVAAVCLACGFAFYQIGAWPVFGFFGLDILILYVAFKINYRDGRAYEEVSVSREELLLKKVDPKGRGKEFRANPFWTRFKVERHDEIGITRMQLEARENRNSRTVDIGSFLNPADRESFASAFGSALAQAKR